MSAPLELVVEPASLVEVSGKDRVDLLHRLSTNNLKPLAEAQRCVSTLFTTNQGKLLDWTLALSGASSLWLCTSPQRAAPLVQWIDTYTIMEDVRSADISVGWSRFSLTGSAAPQAAGLADWPAAGTWTEQGGARAWRGLAAYGPRLELLVPASKAAAWLQRLTGEGAVLLDAAAAEIHRLEAGVPAAATEFPEECNPLELRLTAHAVGWNKGCYIGQEVISRLDSYDKVQRLLVGFVAEGEVSLDPALRVTLDGRSLGRVTSAVPHGGATLGLAVIKRESAVAGTRVDINLANGGTVPATLADRPFFAGPAANVQFT